MIKKNEPKMGFLITNNFLETNSAEEQKNFYVGIRGLPLTWAYNMEGTKVYWIDTRYFIKKAKTKPLTICPDEKIKVNLTSEQANNSNAASLGVLVFDAIKALPKFAGCTFEDVLED
jgi:hypothetical protein